jgi:hypothetical protein
MIVFVSSFSLYVSFAPVQILAVGAEPVLSRITINGAVLSQIKCAPLSAFSVSIHSSGVCTYPPFDPHLNLLFILLLPYLGAAQSVHRREPCLSDGSRCWIRRCG